MTTEFLSSKTKSRPSLGNFFLHSVCVGIKKIFKRFPFSVPSPSCFFQEFSKPFFLVINVRICCPKFFFSHLKDVLQYLNSIFDPVIKNKNKNDSTFNEEDSTIKQTEVLP